MDSSNMRFNYGRMQAEIWFNERIEDNGPFTVELVSFRKRYKNDYGEWDSTCFLRKDDLPELQILCTQVYEFLSKNQEGQRLGVVSYIEKNLQKQGSAEETRKTKRQSWLSGILAGLKKL